MKTFSQLTFVYWIHHIDHTDYLTQGYIGVTSNPKRRWRDHKASSKSKRHCNNHLSNALNKYKDEVVFDILFLGEESKMYDKEKELRPVPNIGWNLMSGGPVGKITPEGRKKLSEASKGRRRTEAQKEQTRWNNFKKKYGEVSLSKYRDIMAVKEGRIPSSKVNVPIFAVYEGEAFENFAHIGEYFGINPFTLYLVCEDPDNDSIQYM